MNFPYHFKKYQTEKSYIIPSHPWIPFWQHMPGFFQIPSLELSLRLKISSPLFVIAMCKIRCLSSEWNRFVMKLHSRQFHTKDFSSHFTVPYWTYTPQVTLPYNIHIYKFPISLYIFVFYRTQQPPTPPSISFIERWRSYSTMLGFWDFENVIPILYKSQFSCVPPAPRLPPQSKRHRHHMEESICIRLHPSPFSLCWVCRNIAAMIENEMRLGCAIEKRIMVL